MSAPGPTGSPRSCSGHMYSGVPTMSPDVCARTSLRTAAPKSMILSAPASSMKMFSGLMSLWTTLFWCA